MDTFGKHTFVFSFFQEEQLDCIKKKETRYSHCVQYLPLIILLRLKKKCCLLFVKEAELVAVKHVFWCFREVLLVLVAAGSSDFLKAATEISNDPPLLVLIGSGI